jgi:hypothetical protein
MGKYLFKVGLVDSCRCDRYKQASEMASNGLCDCEAWAELRFKPLGHHFLKPSDDDISISKGLLNVLSKG